MTKKDYLLSHEELSLAREYIEFQNQVIDYYETALRKISELKTNDVADLKDIANGTLRINNK